MRATEPAHDFDAYFIETYPKLVAELTFLFNSVDLARDVAQEAMIRQYTSWYRLSRYDKPAAWARRVAIRLGARRSRRDQRTTTIDGVAAATVEAVDVDRVLDVRRAIAQLSEKQRVAVVLFYYQDLPIAEIAVVLGCKEPTARVHLHQARQRLAELLVDYAPRSSDPA